MTVIVWDLFGCTGSCAIAPAISNRQFVYCESHKENFDVFAPQVLRALEEAQKKPQEAEICGVGIEADAALA